MTENLVVGGSRDVTTSVPRAVVAYVARALGPGAADAVARAGGLDPDDPRLHGSRGWFAVEEVARLVEAAGRATGDPGIGRRAGEEHHRIDRELGLTDHLLAEGEPGRAIAFAVAQAARMVPVRRYEVVRTEGHEVVVDSTPLSERARDRFHCDLLAGYWSQIPGLFGAVGTVVHASCAAAGDDRCRLVIRWGEELTPAEQELQAKRRRTRELVDRFEELQSVAAELAAIEDVDHALRRIVARAGTAMLAQRFLVTVREQPGAPVRVVASGLPDADADEVADLLWADDDVARSQLQVHGQPVVAPIGEGDAHVGHIVAFLPSGTTVREAEVRLLHAYADHARATIDRILSTAAAQREHRTAAALLRLAHSLAGARTVAEVTELVTEAVAEVTGCEVSGVWLLDPTGTEYHLQVVREDERHDGPSVFTLADPERAVAALVADPAPFVLRRGDHDAVDPVLEGWGVDESYVAPIVHRNRLYGLLATARRSSTDGREHAAVLATVSALAHHAATAIANTELIDAIRHQATHDSLTGLPNRPQIEERAAEALQLAHQHGTAVALAFVDLDRFKIVNDTMGHVAGDVLIGRVAERLEAHLRPSDVVARLGGDEFLVLLTELESPEQAEEVAGRLLEALREPFDVRGESLFVTASLGLACFPQHGRDYGQLLRRADAAMYVAKGEGRNRVAVHRSPVGGHRSRLKLESELHRAVQRDELRVLYQPQVDLLTDEIVAVEALVRWQHPRLGLVGPGTFLSIAEESGLVTEVDRWVRRVAFTQAASWAEAGTPVRIAVNVSRRDLADEALAGSLGELLEEVGLVPDLVELEITDRIVMSDEDLPPSLAGLRELGVRLAVDDFGTGSSVLSRLHHCPFDVLKIDRTFVEPLSRPHPDTRLVDALVSMAHALGLEVVIEGVEDEQQAHVVRMLGADLAQGWLFHRPMAADALTAVLAINAATGAGLPRIARLRPPEVPR